VRHFIFSLAGIKKRHYPFAGACAVIADEKNKPSASGREVMNPREEGSGEESGSAITPSRQGKRKHSIRFFRT
jgi:hypothetical protein